MQITIEVEDFKAQEIKAHYNTRDNQIVKDAVEDILDRYLHVDYLDPELMLSSELKTLE